MALFDSPQTDYPKQWKEYSFDFKLMFGYHGCMMAMFMLGGFLSIKQELLIASVVASTLVSLSLRNRQENNWHWSGAGTKRVLAAVGIAVVASLFDFAALPSAPLSEPRVLPWHLAGLGIAVFGILGALNIVQLSQAEFIKECKATTGANSQNGPNAAVPLGPIDPLWKRVVRGAYYSVFFAVWLSAVSSFYFFGVGVRDGSPAPTVTKTETLQNHGRVVYVSKQDKALIDSLQSAMQVGIPSVLLGGLFLNFVVGVKIFSNVPTLKEWRKNRMKKGTG